MAIQEIKFRNNNKKYSVLLGSNTLNVLAKEIKRICPKTKKIALIFDKNVQYKFKHSLKKILSRYDLTVISFLASEKTKSIKVCGKFFKQSFIKKL